MTVSSSNNKNRYQGNGTTDTFAFVGRIFTANDIAVDIITRATDALVETLGASDYSVTINNSESASIVVDAGKIPSATQDILIRRALSKTQTVDLPTGTRFPAVAVENALDKTTALVQDLSETLTRTVLLPITSSATVPGIGSLTTNEVVVYDGTNFITDGTTTAAIQDAATQASNAASSASTATTQAGLAEDNKDYAEEWAINPEDTPVSIAAGGDGSTTFSALHWAAKAEQLASAETISVTNIDAMTSGGAKLRTLGDADCLGWGAGNAANLTAYGNLSMNTTNKIVNCADPSSAQDVATKAYVDAEVGGITSGGWVPLSTQTVGSPVASVDFTTGIDGTYKAYKFLGTVVFSNDAQSLGVRTSTNAGSSFDNTSYSQVGLTTIANSSTLANAGNTAQSQIRLNGFSYAVGNASGENINFELTLYNPSDASSCTYLNSIVVFKDSSGVTSYCSLASSRDVAEAVNAIRFFEIGGGNFAVGTTITMYGLAGA